MNTRRLVICLSVWACLAVAPSIQAEQLHVGVSVVDITPPIPYRMSGYFRERLSTGTHDPLHAKSLVFAQDGVSAAVVFCDIVGVSHEVSGLARQAASQATGIPAEHIAICATHSHTGPLYFGALRTHFHDRAVQIHGRDPYEATDYPAFLVDQLTVAVQNAHANLVPASIASGYAEETRLSFNRRFHMQDGSVRFNPGQQNPAIVRTAGPIDPQVGLLRFSRPESAVPFAAVIAYALHLDTVGGTEYAADYPYYLERTLRQKLGDDFVSLFAAGTCGDINHIDVSIQTRRTAEEIGTLLAETVEAGLNNKLAPAAKSSLAVLTETTTVPLQTYPQDDIDWARKSMSSIGTRELSFLEQVRAYKIVAIQMRGSDQLGLEVQAIRLNRDAVLVFLPGEVFVELGLAIKAASPFRHTLVIELANDAPGYIPTRKAFAEGSYETVNSRVATGGGEAMVATAVRLVEQLARE